MMRRSRVPASSRLVLLPCISDYKQSSSPVDIIDNMPISSSSNSNITQREGSVYECPSPQVSDLGSEDTHISVNQQSFSHSYASMTPWTNKLTAPGFIPLPKPAPDAMPIPLEHINQEYMFSISQPSDELGTQSWYARSNQIYTKLKPGLTAGGYNQTPCSNETKTGTLHTQRSNFKIMQNKEHRFRRTAEALQKSGLWEVAMKTGSLMKRNRELQKELEEFRSNAISFLKSVIKNPENREFIKNVLNTAISSNAASCNQSSVMTMVVSVAASVAQSSSMLDSSDCSSDDSMSGNTST